MSAGLPLERGHMGLLERELYLDALDSVFPRVLSAVGDIALVSGAAGIGKTSLTQRTAEIGRRLFVPNRTVEHHREAA
jgi:predicted ATPase